MPHDTVMQLLTEVLGELPVPDFVCRLEDLKVVKRCSCLTDKEVVNLLIRVLQKRSVQHTKPHMCMRMTHQA